MNSISDLRKIIETEISKLDFSHEPRDLYDPVNYMLSLPAKRMRPVLVLGACEVFVGDVHKAITPALGIEVFHNFTLLHDDIMDNAPLRRAMPTVHQKWNANVAILSGDTMFVKACQLMMQCDDSIVRQVMELFHKTAIEVCEGQQMDMDFEKSDNVSIDEYIHMITFKTAVLLGASLKTGALIAGASEKESQALYDFGVNTGIAFQLKDDILDVFSDDSKFGKLKGGDIVADKKTFLWIKAHELASGSVKSELEKWCNDKNAEPVKKVEAVTNIYRQLRIQELAEAEMEKYFNKAIKDLNSLNVAEERKSVLRSFAELLMVREV